VKIFEILEVEYALAFRRRGAGWRGYWPDLVAKSPS